MKTQVLKKKKTSLFRACCIAAIILLGLCPMKVLAQYTFVTNTSGTANVGGRNVTVTKSGDDSSIAECGATLYWEGLSYTTSSYTFSFDSAVSHVKLTIAGLSYGQKVAFKVNGSTYSITSANYSGIPSACTGTQNACTISGGMLVGGAYSSAAIIDIAQCNITSVALITAGTAEAYGFVFAFQFNTQPVISGATSICTGTTTTLTSSVTGTGGTWSSSNTSVARVDSAGIVSAVSVGSATITYAVSLNGCSYSYGKSNVTVNSLPNAGTITGTTVTCAGGGTTHFSNSVAGGAWSSSNTSIATVNSAGLVTGITAGNAIISYSTSDGCGSAVSTTSLTVNSLPNAGMITGSSSVCAGGATITLTDASAGGTWNSSSSANATIDGTGIVTGVASGSTNISYSVTNSCGTASTSKTININPLPIAGTITGTAIVCEDGGMTALSDAISGGTWNSSVTAAATIDTSGNVTGVSTGSSIISYSVSNTCGTAVATTTLVVSPLPDAGYITGLETVCPGSAISLHDAATGGTWLCSATSVATVSASGVVTGISSGLATISYLVTNSCGLALIAHDITVNPYAGIISGENNICTGLTTALTETVSGGSWTSASVSVATVNSSGVVTAVTAGIDTINYTITNTCGTSVAKFAINIVPSTITAITGTSASICPGSSSTLTDAMPGGTWSISNATIATINLTTGVVTAIAPGTDTIIYSLTNTCGVISATKTIVITSPALPAGIAGTSAAICHGTSTTFTDVTTGGTWSSTNISIATVSSAGVVTGVAGGTDTILYSITNSCGQVGSQVKTVTVSPTVVGIITGPNNICTLTSIYLSEPTTGGSWSSSSTTVATVSSGGLVYGRVAGNTTIKYTVTNSCGTIFSSYNITVAAPGAIAPITGGASTLCPGANMTFADATTGSSYSWTTSNPAKATINATTGVVTGVSGGIDTIKYTVTNSCGTVSAIKSFTVTGPTLPGGISGAASVCQGVSISLGDGTTGGVWHSNNSGIATITAAGLVTGLTGGVDTITYSVTNSCGETGSMSKIITVNPAPNGGTIAGNATVIVGHNDTLVHSGTAGTWSSFFTAIATVSSSGIVHGVTTGTDTIKYTVTNSCGSASAHYIVRVTASRSDVEPGVNNTGNDDETPSIKLYPNPTTGWVTLEINGKKGSTHVLITDITGRVITNETTDDSTAKFDLSNLHSGIYLFSISNDGHKHYEKITVK